jgi:predicted O-methyltransferase YrrM
MIVRRLEEPDGLERMQEPLEQILSNLRRQKLLRTKPWKGFGEPLNGQVGRRRAVDFLVDDFSPETMVETGTFLGFTTRYLAAFGLPTYTVEISRRYRYAAKSAVANLHNVTMFWGDSAAALQVLAAEQKLVRPLAYLDAHWEEEVPLAAEVECLLSNCEEALIIVDDFYVPTDPGYAYDIYAGVPLSLEKLPLPDGVAIAYPALAAVEETGARRGTLYLAHGTDALGVLTAAERRGLLVIQRDA